MENKCIICNNGIHEGEFIHLEKGNVCLTCYETPGTFCLGCGSKNVNEIQICKDCGTYTMDELCDKCSGHLLFTKEDVHRIKCSNPSCL